jgi:hypothetical protein
MSHNPQIDEIANLIKEQINLYSGAIDVSETGTVIRAVTESLRCLDWKMPLW